MTALTLTNDNVRRHPSCASNQSDTYKVQHGLRFLSSSTKAENIAADFFELFQNPDIASERAIDTRQCSEVFFISYHAAVTALHHAFVCKSIQSSRIQCSSRHALEWEWVRQATSIERPLSLPVLNLAHTKVRLQSTDLSALQIYQRTRLTGAGGMVAILARQFGTGFIRGNIQGVNCKAVHLIIRRASGSYQRMKQVASPYTPRCVFPSKRISSAEYNHIQSEMKRRFDDHAPTQLSFASELISGPLSFHVSEFYANKCIHLIEDEGSKQKWAELETKVQRVRRGELTVYDVLFDPSHNYWVYAIYYTYYFAVKKQLQANTRWTNIPPLVDTTTKIFKQANSVWQSPYSSLSGVKISKSATRYEQTSKMVHILYAFILRTERILSDKFMGVFGLNDKFKNTMLMRFHHLSTVSGDETSTLMMAKFFPCLMTSEIHLDIAVTSRSFQMDTLYVKMSDRKFGKLKKKFKHVIPLRHNGTIARTN